MMADHVRAGRSEINPSAWNRETTNMPRRRRRLWEETVAGTMPPWYYVAVHPEARLAPEDMAVFRAWAMPDAPGASAPG